MGDFSRTDVAGWIGSLKQSDQFRDWQQRLLACLYDKPKKDALIREIHRAIEEQSRAYSEETRARLKDAVVEQLLIGAPRSPDRPKPDDEPPPQPRSVHEIEDLVIYQFPSPIAVSYARMTAPDPGAAAFTGLVSTFTSLVHFLATVIVSAYWRDGAPSVRHNQKLLDRFVKGRWTTGDILELLRETARLYQTGPAAWPCPDVARYLFKRDGTPSTALTILHELVQLRNEDFAHDEARTDESDAETYRTMRPHLDGALNRCDWLTRYSLWLPKRIDDNGVVIAADKLRGVARRKDRPESLPLRLEDIASNGGDITAERTLLLIDEESKQYLPLYPLALSHVQQHAVRSFFLGKLNWKSKTAPLQLETAKYKSFESPVRGDEREFEVRRHDPVATSLEAKINRLAGTLGEHDETLRRLEASVQREATDYDLPQVRSEQEAHLKLFTGRTSALLELSEWARSTAGGEYLVLQGPPGQGKSALLAQLAECEKGYAVFHMIKTEKNPQRFLQFLIWQCGRLSGESFPEAAYQGNLEILSDALFRALVKVTERHGRALLAIDALDELSPADKSLDFLPRVLPEGVRVLLTCRRDDPLLQSIRVRCKDVREQELRPLAPEDLHEFLKAYIGAEGVPAVLTAVDWNTVFHRMNGNPLFLKESVRWVARRLSDGRPIDPLEIPNALDTWNVEFYNDIAEKKPGGTASDRGRIKARMIQFLAVALEPLSISDLQGLLQSDGRELDLEDTRNLLVEIIEYLLVVDGERYKPQYEIFSEYIQGRVLGAQDWQKANVVFCRWLETRARGTMYYLRHYTIHLIRGREFRILSDLVNTDFLENIRKDFSTVMALQIAREIAHGLVLAGDEYWDALLSVAEKYCGLFERLRSDPAALADLVTQRQLQAVIAAIRLHDRDPLYQGTLMMAMSPLFRETGEAELADEMWHGGLSLVQPRFAHGLTSIERYDRTTALMLDRLFARLHPDPSGNQPSAISWAWPWELQPDFTPALAPTSSNEGLNLAQRRRIPLWLRTLTLLGRFRLATYLFVICAGGAGLAVAMFLLSEVGLPTLKAAERIWIVAASVGGLAIISALLGEAARACTQRLSNRIERTITELDAGLGEPRDQRRLTALIRFSSILHRLVPQLSIWNVLPPRWASNLFRATATDPTVAAQLIIRAATFGDETGSALIRELQALDNDKVRADIHQRMLAQVFPAAPHEQVFRILTATVDPPARSGHRASGAVRNYEVVAAYLKYVLMVSSSAQRGRIDRLLEAVTPAGAGKAILSSLGERRGGRHAGLVAECTSYLARTGLPRKYCLSRLDNVLFLIILAPAVLFVSFIAGGFGILLIPIVLIVMLAGRPFDPYLLSRRLRSASATDARQMVSEKLLEPDVSIRTLWRKLVNLVRYDNLPLRAGWVIAPFAKRRSRETAYAQRILRDEPIDPRFECTFSTESLRRVIWTLLKAGFLPPQVIYYFMGDRQLLNRVKRRRPKLVDPPDTSSDGPQLKRQLPLVAAWNFPLVTGVATLCVLLWWWLLWARHSGSPQFWLVSFKYGALPALAIALVVALVQHGYLLTERYLPANLRDPAEGAPPVQHRAVAYQVILGVVLCGALWWFGVPLVRNAARNSGLLAPRLAEVELWCLLSIPIVFSAVIAPSIIGRWRGAGLFYPSTGRIVAQGILSIVVAAAAIVLAVVYSESTIRESLMEEARKQVQNARNLYDKGQYEAAVQAASEAMRFDVNSVEPYLLRCAAHEYLNQRGRADADCVEAVRRAPRWAQESAVGHLQSGREHNNARQNERAIHEANLAIRLHPRFGEAHALRCRATRTDALEQAVVDCTNAVGLLPSATADDRNTRADVYGALSYYLLLAGRPREAIEAAEKGLADDSGEIWIKTNQAHGYLFVGQIEVARRIYEQNKNVKVEDDRFVRVQGQDKLVKVEGRTFGAAVLKDFEELEERKVIPAGLEPEVAKIKALMRNSGG